MSLVRQMLQAHTYWRMHGLMTDLVILNERRAVTGARCMKRSSL